MVGRGHMEGRTSQDNEENMIGEPLDSYCIIDLSFMLC